MISDLGSLAYGWLYAAGMQMLYTTVIFLLCLPVIYTLRNKRPGIVTALCWLILGRLFIPIDSASPISLRSLFDFFMATEPLVTTGSINHASTAAPSITKTLPTLSTADLFALGTLGFWAAISLLFMGRSLWLRRQLYQQAIQGSAPVPAHVNQIFRHWLGIFGVRRSVALVVSEQARFAYTLGTYRPIVVLPAGAPTSLSTTDINAVLAHELGHVARKDDVKILILLIIRSIFFFFPVVWFCQQYLTLAREQLCDRTVLQRSSIKPAAYGESLLHMLDLQQPANGQALVCSLTNNGAMTARFEHLRFVRPQRRYQSWLIALGFSLLAAATWPMATYKNNPPLHTFIKPVDAGRVSSRFGERPSPFGAQVHFHKGIDIAGTGGQAIVATAAGRVLEVGQYPADAMPDSGNYAVVAHDNGMVSRYTHMKEVNVEVGDAVAAGEKIGSMGATGKATGTHLHFELMKDGNHLNPDDYITF